jgi:hypothetical protein
MKNEISRLLERGAEQIVRAWTDKVTSDKRVQTDAQLTYVQLVDHIPEIVEELKLHLANGNGKAAPEQGKMHGRKRWQQGYDLKEVIRELMLLRTTLLEFIETYRGAMPQPSIEQLSKAYHSINIFIDEELYKTVEAYLESQHGPQLEGVAA